MQPAVEGTSPPPARARASAPAWPLRLVILVGLVAIAVVTFRDDAFKPLIELVTDHRWSSLALRPAVLWAAMALALLVVRTALWMRYRPAAEATDDEAPSLSVIIPAYNEGAMVGRSIESIAAAKYPRDKLELFVIDDGSKDDTWEHIERAAARFPGLVTKLQLPKNMGKRHALAAGFRRARGDVLVTIDSDSIIDERALLSIVGPFRDKRIGAVAGRVAVLNREQGLIPRMLAIRFVFTFDLLRAVQSTYGTVACCPGALTAYRADLVRRVLEPWLNQTFLGVPCTIGEDRALTNAIFGEGFDAVYQQTATVFTVVPNTYTQLCKMLLRWDRSFIREEVRYLSVWWRRPMRARLLSGIDTLVNNLRFPVALMGAVTFFALVPSHPLMLLRMACAIGLFGTFNMLYCLHRERSLEIVFGVLYAYFSVVALFWIFPYAFLTVRARGWLTR